MIFSPLANSIFFQELRVNDFEDTMFVDKRTIVVCSFNKKIVVVCPNQSGGSILIVKMGF